VNLCKRIARCPRQARHLLNLCKRIESRVKLSANNSIDIVVSARELKVFDGGRAR